jgi:TolA-binding protein
MKNSMFAVAALSICVGAAQPVWAQDIQERVIRFGHLNNTDHPVSMGVKKFAELVAAKSGGKMQVKEFPSNQLGSEQQQTSALQGGVQEMQSPCHDFPRWHREGLRRDRLFRFRSAATRRRSHFSMAHSARRCSKNFPRRAWLDLPTGTLDSATSPTASGPSPSRKTWTVSSCA